MIFTWPVLVCVGVFLDGTSSVSALSRSARQEDDKEALKWAAIEKLPTYDRLKKGLLTASRGEAFEVDVYNLGPQERQRLINKLATVTEVDNEKFLLKLKNRIERVRIDLPKVEVRYEHLNIKAAPYLASKALPSFTKLCTSIFEGFLNYLHILPSRKDLTMVKDVSGIIKPGRLTLLLGPPASGKTRILLALAGKLDSSLKEQFFTWFLGG